MEEEIVGRVRRRGPWAWANKRHKRRGPWAWAIKRPKRRGPWAWASIYFDLVSKLVLSLWIHNHKIKTINYWFWSRNGGKSINSRKILEINRFWFNSNRKCIKIFELNCLSKIKFDIELKLSIRCMTMNRQRLRCGKVSFPLCWDFPVKT